MDGQTFEDIGAYGVERWLDELAQELKNRTYQPLPVRRVYIPKPDGKQRPLGVRVAGLRSMTAPAVIAWTAHLGRIHLAGSHLDFMSSTWAVGIFTLGAVGEFVADLLPNTPSRTAAVGLVARIVTGSLSGHRWALPAGHHLGRQHCSAPLAPWLGPSVAIKFESAWFVH